MKRIIVIGCPGSGKSHFSKELNKITNIPLFHLDLMFWNSDKTTVEKQVFLQRLSQALSQESWIIDGNYGSTMELRLKACDTVFFLDYPTEVCLAGVAKRKGKPRSDMPWVEDGDCDEEFLDFIKSYNTESKPKVLALLDRYESKEIHVFKSRQEADLFLKQLNNAQ